MKIDDSEVLDTVIAQALKITDLEQTVFKLTKENIRLTGTKEHYERLLEQDRKIILELKGKL